MGEGVYVPLPLKEEYFVNVLDVQSKCNLLLTLGCKTTSY